MKDILSENEKDVLKNVYKDSVYVNSEITDKERDLYQAYYGVNSCTDLESVFPVDLNMSNKPGLKINMLTMYCQRDRPLFLGMLAELENNPDMDLDSLEDTSSEEAKKSKAKAAEILKKILPKKKLPPETGYDFDIEKFNKFVYKNSEILCNKVNKYLQQTMNDSYDEDMKHKNKLYIVVCQALFDAYSQSFSTTPNTMAGLSDKEIANVSLRNKEITFYGKVFQARYTQISTNQKILVKGYIDDGGTDRSYILTNLLSPSSTAYRDVYLDFFKQKNCKLNTEKDGADAVNFVGRVGAVSGALSGSVDAAGIFNYLRPLELSVFVLDKKLRGRIAVDVTKFDVTKADVKKPGIMVYNSEKYGKIDLEYGKRDISIANLALIKTDIYEELRKEKFNQLEPEDKKEIKDYLNLSLYEKSKRELATNTQYINSIIEGIKDELSDTRGAFTGESREFADLMSEMERCSKLFRKPAVGLKDYINRADQLSELMNKSNEYIEHCFRVKKSGDTRATRKKLVENLQPVIMRMNNTVKEFVSIRNSCEKNGTKNAGITSKGFEQVYNDITETIFAAEDRGASKNVINFLSSVQRSVAILSKAPQNAGIYKDKELLESMLRVEIYMQNRTCLVTGKDNNTIDCIAVRGEDGVSNILDNLVKLTEQKTQANPEMTLKVSSFEQHMTDQLSANKNALIENKQKENQENKEIQLDVGMLFKN